MLEQLLYLVFISLGLGFAAWRLLGIKEEDEMSALFLMAGTGIAAFVLLAAVLGLLSLSSWYVYGAVTAGLVALAARKGGITFRLPRMDRNWALVVVLFFIHSYAYVSGAFSYPWLEDDDSWVHAAAVRYAATYGTFIQPNPELIHYLAPYPPFFDALFGVLFQLDMSSLQFTLKFFNALLVSLTIPLFYCWVRARLDGRTALWATFILAILPSFMSHFIWSQTLAMVLVFPAFYFLDRVLRGGENKMALVAVSVLSLGAVLMSQPSVAGIIFIMALLYAGAAGMMEPAVPGPQSGRGGHAGGWTACCGRVATLMDRTAVPFLALALALLLFWGPMFVMYGMNGVLGQLGLNPTFITDKNSDTSQGVIYSPDDFFQASLITRMDQPTGWGAMVSALLLLGIQIAVIKAMAGDGTARVAPGSAPGTLGAKTPADAWRALQDRWFGVVLLLWFVFGIAGVEGNALPLKMMPHRFWVFLAIPVAILAGQGAVKVLEYVEKNRKVLGSIARVAKVAMVISLLTTSAYPKAAVEMSEWAAGIHWASDEQLAGYVRLKELPANTKVFGFCMGEEFADGVDKAGYAWVKEVNVYKTHAIGDSVDDNYAFLKKYGYEYAVIDQSCLRRFTGYRVDAKLAELGSDRRFTLEPQLTNLSNGTFAVLRVN